MRRPTRYRDNPKARRRLPPPDGVDVRRVAENCRYVGSPYHRRGATIHRRPDATLCPEHLSNDRQRVEDWLRESIRAGRTGAWEQGFPKYVWHVQADTVYEARQSAPGSGEYHGYPLHPTQSVRDLLRDL